MVIDDHDPDHCKDNRSQRLDISHPHLEARPAILLHECQVATDTLHACTQTEEPHATMIGMLDIIRQILVDDRQLQLPSLHRRSQCLSLRNTVVERVIQTFLYEPIHTNT